MVANTKILILHFGQFLEYSVLIGARSLAQKTKLGKRLSAARGRIRFIKRGIINQYY